CWVENVATFESPNAPTSGAGAGTHLQSGGISVNQSKRVTVTACDIGYAENRGTGGNGYLYEVVQSNEILYSHNTATAGRHNFIQNWGFGTSGVVWHDVVSLDGAAVPVKELPQLATIGYSELHHSLAMANLVDNSYFSDGWSMINRLSESSGAGHTGTENVLWNIQGPGLIRSANFGWGYVIGTAPETGVAAPFAWPLGEGTLPQDFIEGEGLGAGLEPSSLYLDQLQRRTGFAADN
ncbi:MAG: hypothetical protein KC561_14415, partial [Myxococcales bacterium]|nr:hypothetical protein [Myxococcales bacterium]